MAFPAPPSTPAGTSLQVVTELAGAPPAGHVAEADGLPTVNSRLLLRMRAWFAAVVRGGWTTGGVLREEHSTRDRQERFPRMDRPDGKQAAVIPFPLSANARLTQLANDLREGFTKLGLEGHDAIDMHVTPGTAPQLWIDGTAHVELQSGEHEYRVVLANVFGARLTLESGDPETIRQFVGHYVIAKLAEAGERAGRR